MTMINLNWQPGMTLDVLEEHAIKQAFKFYSKNKSATSRALNISIRTLETKLEKYATDDAATEERTRKQRADADAFMRRQRGLPPLEVETGAPVPPTSRGVHVQPPAHAQPQHGVSLSVGQEVQAMPSPAAAGSGQRKRR